MGLDNVEDEDDLEEEEEEEEESDEEEQEDQDKVQVSFDIQVKALNCSEEGSADLEDKGDEVGDEGDV